MLRAHLIEIDWPDYGVPEPPPPPARAALLPRLAAIRAGMEARGLSHLVVYADREHAANIAWTTGFEPRFEEAVLIVPGAGVPLLLARERVLPLHAGLAPGRRRRHSPRALRLDGTWRVQDLESPIRHGLLGAGRGSDEVRRLVRLWVHERPPMESVMVARAILMAAVYGAPEDEPGKSPAASQTTDLPSPTAG